MSKEALGRDLLVKLRSFQPENLQKQLHFWKSDGSRVNRTKLPVFSKKLTKISQIQYKTDSATLDNRTFAQETLFIRGW